MNKPSLHSLSARGFSLIEVLVSMFIVSLGILALAGLMQASSRYGKTSELRSTATLLANDIADHIRANGAGASAGGYNLVAKYMSTIVPAAPPVDCKASVCNPAQVAAYDEFGWLTRLQVALPGGNAYVQYQAPAVPPSSQRGSVDVWVAWTDPAPASTVNERPAGECSDGLLVGANYAVRCVYLQVGL